MCVCVYVLVYSIFTPANTAQSNAALQLKHSDLSSFSLFLFYLKQPKSPSFFVYCSLIFKFHNLFNPVRSYRLNTTNPFPSQAPTNSTSCYLYRSNPSVSPSLTQFYLYHLFKKKTCPAPPQVFTPTSPLSVLEECCTEHSWVLLSRSTDG